MPSGPWNRNQIHRYAGPERRTRSLDMKALFAAAMIFAGIAFATLCPLELRPRLGNPNVERFGAYLLLGLCTSFALPRRPATVIFAVTAVAVGLEAGQLLVPGRDAAFFDACIKAMGGAFGTFLSQASYFLGRRFWPRSGRRRSVSRLTTG
jgi:hypothetical protein